jgi:iron complex transport system substrate-binding protein
MTASRARRPRSEAARARSRRGWLCVATVALTLMATTCGGARADNAKPQHVVSINMCTDELLLRLAEPDHIASVTWLSQNPREANMAGEAAHYPPNHGLAEEALSFKPDLVLAGAFTTRTTIALLKRTGMRVVEFGVPRTLNEVRQQVRDVADVLGEKEKGEALITEMDARLEEIASQVHGKKLRAIVLRPNGFTVGRGSLIDDIMERAGLDNLADRLGIDTYLQIPLEAVVVQEADVLILNGESGGLPSLATEALHHPIIAGLSQRLKLVSMPSRLWTCAGPSVIDAIALLIAATRGRVAHEPPS